MMNDQINPRLSEEELEQARRNMRLTRLQLGLTQSDFARAIGYQSAAAQRLRTQVNDMEHGRKPISPIVARLVEMFRRFGAPADFFD
jgi:transcriptional regulator with XRE-family HTH domain